MKNGKVLSKQAHAIFKRQLSTAFVDKFYIINTIGVYKIINAQRMGLNRNRNSIADYSFITILKFFMSNQYHSY